VARSTAEESEELCANCAWIRPGIMTKTNQNNHILAGKRMSMDPGSDIISNDYQATIDLFSPHGTLDRASGA